MIDKKTIEELRVLFEEPRLAAMRNHTDQPELPRYNDGQYYNDMIELKWQGFLEAAKVLGVLE